MKKRKKLMIWINTLPAMILIGAIIVFPILYTAYISFTNMNLFHWNDYKFVGIENYVRALFKVDAGFLSAILTTILEMLFIFGGLIGGAISGVLFCLKLLLSKKGKNALLQILIVLGISVVYSVTVLIIAFVFGLSIGIIRVL